MWKHVIGQGLFQLAVNFGILYAAPALLGVEAHSTRHLTLFFNTFVLCQVFNEINARRINDELNVFDNFFDNPIFLSVIGFTLSMQYLLVQFGGSFAGTEALSSDDWALCFGIASLSLPIGFILRLFEFEKIFVKTKSSQRISSKPSLQRLVKKQITLSKLQREPSVSKVRWEKAIHDVAVQRSIISWLRRNRKRSSSVAALSTKEA